MHGGLGQSRIGKAMPSSVDDDYHQLLNQPDNQSDSGVSDGEIVRRSLKESALECGSSITNVYHAFSDSRTAYKRRVDS